LSSFKKPCSIACEIRGPFKTPPSGLTFLTSSAKISAWVSERTSAASAALNPSNLVYNCSVTNETRGINSVGSTVTLSPIDNSEGTSTQGTSDSYAKAA